MKKSKLRKSRDREHTAKVVTGRPWHLASVFALLQTGAQEGVFSASVLETQTQFSLLLVLLGVVLFGFIKLPGILRRRAQLRVVEIDGEVVGHTFLIWQCGGVEVATCAINKSFRRSGIGQILIEDAVKVAEILPVDAYCLPKAHAMCMLLRSQGFIARDRLQVGAGPNVVLQHWQFLPASHMPDK